MHVAALDSDSETLRASGVRTSAKKAPSPLKRVLYLPYDDCTDWAS